MTALRLFLALDLPDDVREAIGALRPDASVWRPVSPESLHITLAFLGSRPPDDVALIEPVVSAEAGGAAPLLALGDVLLLPPRRARVMSVAIEDVDGTLAALQARVSGALAAAGVYTPEKRPFHPHVTVARLRPRTPAPRDVALTLDRQEFRGEAVTLYVSRLHPSGTRYEAISRARSG
jgi:2'-5' RNA ligase